MAELMETLNAAESVVRWQLKNLGDQVERQNCGGWTYYRLHKNGKRAPQMSDDPNWEPPEEMLELLSKGK